MKDVDINWFLNMLWFAMDTIYNMSHRKYVKLIEYAWLCRNI